MLYEDIKEYLIQQIYDMYSLKITFERLFITYVFRMLSVTDTFSGFFYGDVF
jgi:hypothetical protein